MRKFIIVLLCLIGIQSANAQIHELGVFAGGSNYIGDVGKTNYVNPDHLSLGLLYKWNRSIRHAWRVSYTHGKISGNDLKSKAPSRVERGYKFNNSIDELALGIEFNFYDFDLHSLDLQITPYIHTGVAGFKYDENYFDAGVLKSDGDKFGLAIPMTVGVKTNLLSRLVIGVETGFRYTFTDNLDGSNPKDNRFEANRFGNLDSKDWYVFTGVTLTYTFGKNPCFCAN